ncbi:unnamed protein product [Paramecium sonneborni]|uniref:Protein kinase domain-containing protein n=1 Tax=Paramecium sonneborni TaxID=65129 RepID=A0A8S1LDD8_9CILI|nr:unnamed protein product [Paramecium sonneborni]
MQQNKFDYSLSIFHCQIKKKKLIGWFNRYVYLFEDKLIMNKDSKKGYPMKIYSWTQIKKVIWKYKKSKKTPNLTSLRNIIIVTEKEQKKYYGESETLLALKRIIAKYVYQESIQDEFERLETLGQGSYSLVVQLKHLHSNLQFAAKCIDKKQLSSIEHGTKAVQNEIYIMRILSPHTQIVNLHEVYDGDNNIYLILDLCQGGSLLTEIKKRQCKFDDYEIQQIMENILSAVEYIHSKDIMHRDLKPENILLSNPNDFSTLKIADFGLSAISKLTPYLFPKCGTPGFVAPEKKVANMNDKSRGYSKKCDIFSCGAIFHLLLLGKEIFQGKGNAEMLKLNKECNINPADLIYSTLPPLTKDLLFKMLEVNPEKRLDAYELLHHQYFKIYQFNKLNELNEQEIMKQ